MTTKPRVAVVIPNYNGGTAVLDAVASLLNQSPQPHVIVVDNASEDGSADAITASHPEVELVRNPRNLGYAGGVNAGLRPAINSGCEFVGVFNDDATAQPGWLSSLVGMLEGDAAIGAVTSKVLDVHGTTFDSAGDLMTTWGIPVPRGRGEPDIGQYDESVEVFSASGAACMFRASALAAVGLFDEDFFAYFEDADLGFRMRLAGWKIVYCPAARVHHIMHMTSARNPGFITFQTMKNVPLVLAKNLPSHLLAQVLPRFLLAQTLLTVWAVKSGQGRAAFRGHAKALSMFRSKRRDGRASRAASPQAVDEIQKMFVRQAPPGRPDLEMLLRIADWFGSRPLPRRTSDSR